MLRTLRRAALQQLRNSGIFRLVADGSWRRQRLLILCYHGISRTDEHVWRPASYMQPEVFRQRLEILQRNSYNVLPLGEALTRLQAAELPPRSVAITFDDGGYDFYASAFPLIQTFAFPVTVYQTTYYSDYQKPIFNLVCSYILWKRRGRVLPAGSGSPPGPSRMTSSSWLASCRISGSIWPSRPAFAYACRSGWWAMALIGRGWSRSLGQRSVFWAAFRIWRSRHRWPAVGP